MNTIQASLSSYTAFTGINIKDWDKGWNFPSAHSNISDSGYVLPVTLISFNALEVNGEIIIKWIIENEINNSHFSLERSVNGKDFTSIGTIEGAGTTNEVQFYIFADKNAPSGSVYYRLLQFDYNGNSNISNVIHIDIRKFSVLKVNPNPFDNHITIESTEAEPLGECDLTLKNSYGKIIFSSPVNFTNDQKVEIYLPDIPPGIYILKIVKGERIRKVMMVKQ
ncbi:MAG: T9SS type A sorting domain-containing protein [Cytophagaceae bacterium]|nr:T9SS type A sorting domain-containing protein [Cytophagaceae bacterium]